MKCVIWNIHGRQITLVLDGHIDRLTAVVYSPDGLYIGTSSNDQTICLWNAVTGAPTAWLAGHTQAVRSIAFTPNGRSIVSCSKDKAIRVWNVKAACSPPPGQTKYCLLPNSDSMTPGQTHATLVNGWLTGPSGELLLWVPANYHQYVPAASCTLYIQSSRLAIFARGDTVHCGEAWQKCWRG